MNKEDAVVTLGLSKNYSNEMIFEAYRSTYLGTLMRLSQRHTDSEAINEKLSDLNKAFRMLDSSIQFNEDNPSEILFDLGIDIDDFRQQQPANFEVFPEFDKLIEKTRSLIDEGQYGLAIRLMEIGIQRSFKLNRYRAFTGQRRLIRTMGKLLVDIGLTGKGMELLTAGSINYYIGKTYFEIKDYHSAIKYFGRELKEKDAKVTSEDIILSIVKCYFLLGEYNNCLHIIERVLPNFQSMKKNGWPLTEKSSKMLLFAISKVENLSKGILVKFKLKLKYPVSYRCISQHIESFKDSLKFLDEISDEQAFQQFLKSIEPTFRIVENPMMNYTEEILNEVYYEVFAEPLNASQLYNKK